MSGEKPHDSSNDSLILSGFVILVILAIGYFFKKQIIKALLSIKLLEAKIILLLPEFMQDMLAYLPSSILSKEIPDLQLEVEKIKSIKLSLITYGQAFEFSSIVGLYYTIPLTLIFAFFTFKIWNKNPLKYFKKSYNMKSLAYSEVTNWPYITPALGIDLLNEPMDKGPWAMALKPYEFVLKYKLLDKEGDITSLNKMKVEKLFASQLGPLWEGPDKLPKHLKALFGIFSAQGCKNKEEAGDAIFGICETSQTSTEQKKPKPDFSKGLALFEKYKNNPEVLKICSKHAYVSTVMASMLEFARTSGVLPSSFMLWLRPYDRITFYTLNCVGRKVPFIEIAGIFSHWQAEKVAGHAIEKPYVSKAFEGLEIALQEIKI